VDCDRMCVGIATLDSSGTLAGLLYIVPLGVIFRDKPQTIFSVAREEFAFYVRGTTALRPVAGG